MEQFVMHADPDKGTLTALLPGGWDVTIVPWDRHNPDFEIIVADLDGHERKHGHFFSFKIALMEIAKLRSYAKSDTVCIRCGFPSADDVCSWCDHSAGKAGE